jgi:hypothetical protein
LVTVISWALVNRMLEAFATASVSTRLGMKLAQGSGELTVAYTLHNFVQRDFSPKILSLF